MKIFNSPKLLQEEIIKLKKRGKIIGLVPTMGALHKGHLTLVRKARQQSDLVVASIFVNPLQFGLGEDFQKYPRNLAFDRALLNQEKVDYLFFPDAGEIYPPDFKTEVEVKKISELLCGRARPGHFKGVATVVLKLFNIIGPDLAFFGEKDYQQLLIIKQMVKDLNLPVKIVACPIVREKDGLAASSRNFYLSSDERKSASILYKALLKGKQLIKSGQSSGPAIVMAMKNLINTEPRVKIDYLAVVDPATLEEVRKITGSVRLMLAVVIGSTRLIDNLQV